MKSVLLDFCNMDVRRTWGLFNNFTPEQHKSIISKWINLACFMCEGFCVLPLGFLAECQVLRDTIAGKFDYCTARHIRFAAREADVSAFLQRRRSEYEYESIHYAGLYTEAAELMLERVAPYLLPRSGRTGVSIADRWADRADDEPHWHGILDLMNARQVDRLRTIPAELLQREQAVLWREIAAQASVKGDGLLLLRNVLNRDLLVGYRNEYELGILTNLPFGWRDITMGSRSARYNVDFLERVIGPELMNVICCCSAEDMLELREREEFLLFQLAWLRLIASEDPSEFGRSGTRARSRIRTELDMLRDGCGVFVRFDGPEFRFTKEWKRRVYGILGALSYHLGRKHTHWGPAPFRGERTTGISMERVVSVALFAALEMEQDIIVKQFSLRPHGRNTWEGDGCGVKLYLYTPHAMGRVNAAVSTMAFLQEQKPDLIIVAGIAGAFEKAGAMVGQIVVPFNIIDLSVRKLYEDTTEFRPAPHNLDRRLAEYLKSPQFKTRFSDWSNEAIEFAEWPKGLRPSIEFEDLTSLDEVVSDTNYIARLLNAYPKLFGVEMEAGGVCAAAQRMDVPVCVMRGLSDKADPSKKDDEWRRRVMKTLVHLLSGIDLASVLAPR